MKSLLRSIAALSAACGLVSAADSTHELRDSLLARGDFNGDGRTDVAAIDRVTGLVRIAHTLADGSLDWSEGHHTGIAPATGVAAGRFLASTRDALAITSTTANRTNIFDLSNLASLPVPLSVFTPATGPTGVSAAQVVGGTALEEIIVHHTQNGATPQARAFVRFSGSPVTAAVFQPSLPAPTVADLELRPRRIEGLATAAVASFTGTSPVEGFRLLRVGIAPVQLLASLDGLPHGADFVHADFDGAATTSPAQFVFFNRGASSLHRSSLSAANAFSAIATTDAGAEIEHVTAVARSGGGWNLLVVFEAGWAQIFSFDGQSAPVPGEVFPAPADGGFLGTVASGPGDFHLLAGLPLARAHRFTWDGTSHTPNGVSDLPPLRSSRPATNVFAFNNDPFIATGAVLLGSFSAGEWTREGKIVAGAIEAAQSRFANPTSGLGDFSDVNLGPHPPGTTFVMTNEIPSFQPGVPSYASAYGPTRALGRTIGEVTITPAPGRMLRSIRPTFTAPPGVTVFWRVGGGGWIPLVAQAPGWQFQAFTIQWFGRGADGATTPVYQAAYTFAEPPDTLDSDDDGVPDFVEIAKGLDPVLSGDDADGDGASDLLELLSDTSPSSNASFPTRTNGPPGSLAEFDGNYQNTFFFRITPLAIAGSNRYATLGAEAAGVALHDPNGLRLGANQTVGSTPQHARIGNIQAGYAGSLLVAGTDANFDLTAPAPNKRRGRELVGLIPVPFSDLGPVPFDYPGGDLAAAANAWVTAARAHHSQPVPSAVHTLDTTTTLCLLLVELKFEEILRARSELDPAQTLSLTPYRPAESTRPLEERTGAPADASFRLSAADMDRLRRYAGTPPAFDYAIGWRPGDVYQSLAAALATPPSPAVTELVRLAREVHFLSAAADDATLPQFPPPVDTLRRFLRTARLPGDSNENGVIDPGETLSYWGNLSLTPAEVATAHSAIAALLALPPSRPTTTGVFVVDAATFNGPVPVVRETPTLAPHVLLQGNGEPWPLAQFARLPVGAELTVTGFSDVASPHAPSAVEVIWLSLTKLPSAPADFDNNLLGDGWQGLFPGIGVNGPFTDSDGDGASDLQEYLAGTDPTDPASVPPDGPVDLSPPALVINPGETPGTFQISFNYPAAYADKIAFHLQQSDDLVTTFADTGVLVPHLGSGAHGILLNPAAAQASFWRARLGLK